MIRTMVQHDLKARTPSRLNGILKSDVWTTSKRFQNDSETKVIRTWYGSGMYLMRSHEDPIPGIKADGGRFPLLPVYIHAQEQGASKNPFFSTTLCAHFDDNTRICLPQIRVFRGAHRLYPDIGRSRAASFQVRNSASSMIAVSLTSAMSPPSFSGGMIVEIQENAI